MKAIILAAGIGSRIRPLTEDRPKCLLEIDEISLLQRMIFHIRECGVDDILIVVGYLQNQIRDHVRTTHPDIDVQYVINDRYQVTNAGYSLMLALEAIDDDTIIKFDADVAFERDILTRLIECDDGNYLCLDRDIKLDEEEIKVIVENGDRVVKASKTVDPRQAVGESIGIEKLDRDTVRKLRRELQLMMKSSRHHQDYYEAAYERLIAKSVPFYTLDITGLKWTEIDTTTDLRAAERQFGQIPGPDYTLKDSA